MRASTSILFIAAAATLSSGCTFDENLNIENLYGTVVLAEEAAQREIIEDGEATLLDDVRLIGPVILGLYPEVGSSQFTYTHPVVGPSFQDGNAGDTFPYGGTTIGDIRFSCLQSLQCKVVSGRYVDYQALIDWQNRLGQPVTDAFNEPVTSGEYLRQVCFDILEATSDEEVRIIPTEDRNGDDVIGAEDLDFVQRADGKWEAPFVMYQQEFFDGNTSAGAQGFSLWGWMDSPTEGSFDYDTCFTRDGFSQEEYNVTLTAGRQQRNLLNIPSQFIDNGDFVAAEPFVYDSVDDIAELEIGFRVEDQ